MHNLWLKLKKCKFLKSQFKYHELIISQNHIQMDLTKVKAVSDGQTTQKHQQTPMIHGFVQLLQEIHWPLPDNKLLPSLFDQSQHPVCLDDTIQHSLWGGEGGVNFLSNIGEWRPVKASCTGMQLLRLCTRRRAILALQGRKGVAPIWLLLLFTDPGWMEPWDLQQRPSADMAFFKQWRSCLKFNPNRLKFIVYTNPWKMYPESKRTDTTTGTLRGDNKISQWLDHLQTRKASKTINSLSHRPSKQNWPLDNCWD